VDAPPPLSGGRRSSVREERPQGSCFVLERCPLKAEDIADRLYNGRGAPPPPDQAHILAGGIDIPALQRTGSPRRSGESG